MPVLRKIISEGQTGADRAGLDFAIEVGLAHGGYVPKGRKAEDDRIDEKYTLVELSSNSYPERTKRNVRESDGTVILSLNEKLSGGTALKPLFRGTSASSSSNRLPTPSGTSTSTSIPAISVLYTGSGGRD
jgi:hypothetical protein